MPVRPLCAVLKQIAEEELNEVSSRVPQDLENIREWLLKQPHIKARMDDQWLIVFLRSCKFSLERTKEKLDRFYTLRPLAPEIFCNRHLLAENIQQALSTRCMVILSDTLQYTKPTMMLASVANLNPHAHTLYDIWKVITMTIDMYLVEEDTLSINGFQVVVDFKNFNFNYAGQHTPTYLKNTSMIVQKTYPVRIKKLVAINANSWFIQIVNALKLLLSNKLKERIVICDAHSSSEYSFPKLIKEYCGKDSTWDELAAEQRSKLEKFQDWFLEDLQYGVDETKRPEKEKIIQDVYGSVQGAFRNLDID